MKHLSILGIAALALSSGSVAAQENNPMATQKITLFEGQTIERLYVSGDFDVEVRQGTPNSLVLEIPTGVPVDSNAVRGKREGYTIEDVLHGVKADEDEQDRVYCSLHEGYLYLSNGYLKTCERNGGRSMQTVSNFKGRAVITVGDLSAVSFYSKGTFRLAEGVRLRAAAFDFFNRTDLSGLRLTATESLSIRIFNYSRFEARIFDTPSVKVSVFNQATADLTLDGVKTMGAKAFNSGRLRLRGRVERLAKSHFNGGTIDIDSLQVDSLVVGQQQWEGTAIIGIGSTLGIGRATRVVTAVEGGMTLREPKPGDEALPVAADDERTFTLARGTSLVLHGGTYKLTEVEEGKIVLHKIDQTIRYQPGKIKRSKNRK